MNRTQTPERLFGYDVLDSGGTKIGSVDNVWLDEATRQLEFVGVQTGWLGLGKTHLIPAADAQVDDASRTIQTTYDEEQIKSAPSYGAQVDLTPDDENRVYSYYGLQRSTAPSPTGLASTTGTAAASTTGETSTASGQAGGYGQDRGDITGQEPEDVRVPLTEEQLTVGKRQVEAGRVRLRKVVRTEQVAVPVELRREEVHVERVPASGTEVPGDAFQEREIEVPAMREEPVVSKQPQVTGEVRIGKTAETEKRTVGDEVRKEEVEVDESGETGGPRLRDER
jgi:uncharacterized protein (TIGR02271 family)